MWTERSPGIYAVWKEQNQENIVHRDCYIMAQLKVMDFSTSSNAMIQDNPKELRRKNTIYIQRKNFGTRNVLEKYMINHVFR